jgi:hypothetical protein
MDDPVKEKEIIPYYCEKCNYSTKNKKDYHKHVVTNKHKNEFTHVNKDKFTCFCGTLCNSRTTLWRHKKKCTNTNQDNINNLTLAVLELVKSNHQLFDLVKNNINPK